MAKQRNTQRPAEPIPEPPAGSARGPLAFLVVGVLIVGGLVVWALTRTVEVQAPVPVAEQTSVEQTSVEQTAAAELDTSALNATAARNTPPIAPPIAPPSTNTAFTPPVRPPEVQGDKGAVARIAPEDLKAKWGRGEVTVIDVRDAASYASSHIPGALHMQFASIEGQIDAIPKGKPIVLYCT